MKIKLGVFFGGNSVEHEISIITMIQAMEGINEEKYEIVPIYISKSGRMYTGDDLLDLEQFKDMDVLLKRCYQVTIVNDGDSVKVVRFPSPIIGKKVLNTIDIAFPIVHGTNVEDGTIAGYLNMFNIPIVGPDVLASALGMDKIVMKKVLHEAGIPIVNYVGFYSNEYIKDEDEIIDRIEKKLRYPLITKPANSGSSVGIKKSKNRAELQENIEFAMEFSDRIIVENAVENLQEINCSVIGNVTDSEASVCEEPFFSDEILSYSDKYLGGSKSAKGGAKGAPTKAQSHGKGMAASDKKLPADIPDETRDRIQDLTKQTFKALGCAGVARVDFLIDKDTNEIFVNEINTIPGALSYYLWEASGKTVEEEMEQIIDIAIKRHNAKEKLTFSYDENILAMQAKGGAKGGKMKMGTKGVKANK